jgi:predicted kinase
MNLKELKEPFVIVLVGVPLVGKSTFIRENFEGTTVISRDEIVMEVSESRNYTEAWEKVDQKKVDRLLMQRLNESNKEKRNVIIDMTNLTVKSRVSKLNLFSKDYFKVAVIFPVLSNEEFERRNEERKINENKFIPLFVVKKMINSYEVPTSKEGFDKIIKI